MGKRLSVWTDTVCVNWNIKFKDGCRELWSATRISDWSVILCNLY